MGSDEEQVDLSSEMKDLEEKAKKHESNKEFQEAADLFAEIAETYSQVEEVETAIQFCEKEIRLRNQLQDFAMFFKSKVRLALLLQREGKFEESIKIVEETMEKAKEKGEIKYQAKGFAELSTFYLAKYESSLLEQEEDEEDEEDNEAERNQEEEKTEKDKVDEEELMTYLTHAITFGEEALKICYSGSTSKDLMTSKAARNANHAMGEAYMHIGETEKATPHFDQVLDISRKKNSADFGEMLLYCAKAYFGVAEAALSQNTNDGEEEQEEEEEMTEEELEKKKQLQVKMANQSLALFKERLEMEDVEDAEKSICLAGFVSCYELLGDVQKMIESQQKILEMDEKEGDNNSIIQSLATLADMLEENQQPQEALTHYKRALALAKKENEEQDLIESLEEKIVDLQSKHKDSLQSKKRKPNL